MTGNRHNIQALNDGGDFPAPFDASAGDLGRVIEKLATLAPELTAPVVTEELRLAQYRRVSAFGAWLAEAAEDLEKALTTELNRRNGASR